MHPFARTFRLLYDTPGDPPGGGPAGSGAPAPPAPPAGPGAAPGAPGGGGPAGDPGGGGRQFSYPEDRSTWIPPYRLEEVNGRVAAIEAERERQQGIIRALTGVAQPRDPRQEEVRRAFLEVFPELQPLVKSPKAFEDFLQAHEDGTFETARNSGTAMWQRHGFQMASQMADLYAEQVGRTAADLGPGAVRRFARELAAFIADDRTGQRQQRFEMGDQSVLSECLTEITGFFVAPANRQQAVQNGRRVEQTRTLPHGAGRGAVAPNAAAGGEPRFANRKERFRAMREAYQTATQGGQ